MIPRDIEPAAKYFNEAMAELGFKPQPTWSPGESSRVTNYESNDKDLVRIQLLYDGLNTRAQLQGTSAEAREAPAKDSAAKK